MGDYLTHRLCLAAIAGIFVPLVVDLHEVRGLYFLAISISHAGTDCPQIPPGRICARLGEAAAAAAS